ncbi:hypothetical protein ACLOJK_004879 [Asimina triloba]
MTEGGGGRRWAGGRRQAVVAERRMAGRHRIWIVGARWVSRCRSRTCCVSRRREVDRAEQRPVWARRRTAEGGQRRLLQAPISPSKSRVYGGMHPIAVRKEE